MKKITLNERNIPVDIKIKDLKFLPKYQTDGSVACDLAANLEPDSNGERILRMRPGQVELVDVGFSMAIPDGWEAQIRPRSGHSIKKLKVANSPATIDSDFRGALKVILHNDGKDIIIINHGERIAQMLLKPIWKFKWNIVEELSETIRGENGFGSTN